MGKNKTRYICDLTFCRHINTENICTIGNQENCVYYRTLQALNGYKENAKWCDDCKKIKELEAEKDKAWWEGFDTCKAKAGEANVKLSDEITLLKAQIEKMKCCSNCDNWNWKHNKCEKKLKGDCFKHSKWVMRNF
jgi:hypothetical protein